MKAALMMALGLSSSLYGMAQPGTALVTIGVALIIAAWLLLVKQAYDRI